MAKTKRLYSPNVMEYEIQDQIIDIKKKCKSGGYSYNDIMLLYEDPDLYFKAGTRGDVSLPVEKGDLFNRVACLLLISKEKVREKFVIVDDIPETGTTKKYLLALSKEIRANIFHQEISEDKIEEIRQKVYTNLAIKSTSIEELKEEEKIYSDYFRYLFNKDKMGIIYADDFKKISEIIEEVKSKCEFIRQLPASKGINIMEDGISYNSPRVGDHKFTYISLSYVPDALYLGMAQSDLLLVKYTEGSIYKFHQEFIEKRYDLEAAHASILIKGIITENIKFNVLVYDKYGRHYWYYITDETINKATKEYEQILCDVQSLLTDGKRKVPSYVLNEDYNKL